MSNQSWKLVVAGGLVAAMGTQAHARGHHDRREESQHHNRGRSQRGGPRPLERVLEHPAPGPGLEKAPVRAPAWCAQAPKGDWELSSVANAYSAYKSQRYWDQLVKAAGELCSVDPNDASVQAAAA